jgi:hypothetical protein
MQRLKVSYRRLKMETCQLRVNTVTEKHPFSRTDGGRRTSVKPTQKNDLLPNPKTEGQVPHKAVEPMILMTIIMIVITVSLADVRLCMSATKQDVCCKMEYDLNISTACIRQTKTRLRNCHTQHSLLISIRTCVICNPIHINSASYLPHITPKPTNTLRCVAIINVSGTS